ncbi:type II toxin-antitoxin system RelE/ParE family toxin [Patescibacteria group bacterium]
MDKIKKFLKKLTKKEKEAFMLLMCQLKKNYKKVPDIKKMTSKKQCYRVRLGKYRIIFIKKKNEIEIIRITKRDERTYKDF